MTAQMLNNGMGYNIRVILERFFIMQSLEIFQISANDEFTFLYIKRSWSPEGVLKFVVFRNNVQQFKYFGKVSTHTPVTLHAIPLGVLKCPAKFASRKPILGRYGR